MFQEKLQNSFRQATSKISATIGLGLPREQNGEPAVTVDDTITAIDADDAAVDHDG